MNLDLQNGMPDNDVRCYNGGFKMEFDDDILLDVVRPDYGFLFRFYGSGHVSNSRPLDEDECDQIPIICRNIQNLAVECKACGEYMRLKTDDPYNISRGWYVCPHCGRRLRETTLYNQLDRETEAWIRRNPECAEDYVYDENAWLEDL